MIIVASVLLGAVFVLSGVAKMASPRQWRTQSADLGVPAAVAGALPFVELVVGAMLIAQLARGLFALIAAALIVAFTTVLIAQMARGRRPPCACFGSMSSRPISWVDLARNACFLAVALGIVVAS